MPLISNIEPIRRGSRPAIRLIGAEALGHFVKMVHNGIEYAQMQLISELYFILRHAHGLGILETVKVFDEWRADGNDSSLLELTGTVLPELDPRTEKLLIDTIGDVADGNGTGLWAVQEAIRAGIHAPLITTALGCRISSAYHHGKRAFSKDFIAPNSLLSLRSAPLRDLINSYQYISILIYVEGMSLLKTVDPRELVQK